MDRLVLNMRELLPDRNNPILEYRRHVTRMLKASRKLIALIQRGNYSESWKKFDAFTNIIKVKELIV